MKVWQIFTEYADHDKFPWDSSFKYDTKKAGMTYSDGTMGQWESDTANDPKAGISGTRQVIWYTEAARYAKAGARTDLKVITASLNSLAKVPHSLALMESTAEGANGYFYENWQRAATMDDFRNGIHGNGWVKVFAAWFEFEEHTLQRLPNTEQHFHREFTSREKRGIQLYGWDEYQIAWRRSTIENECGGDEHIFDQDFPENDRDCFLQSGRPRFDDDGVTRLEIMSAAEHDLASMGVLSGEGTKIIFIEQKDNPWLWLKEQPKAGCSYIVACDPCTGEQSRGAKNPDAHAAVVLRQAYVDEGGRFFPAELVAAIHVDHGCRWDASMIAERVVMLSNYFGGVKIVCEANGAGAAVIVKLQDFHGNIYQRMKEDSYIPGKFLPTAGWETTSSTRELWVQAVADAIREQEKAFNCCYIPAVREMRTFVIDDRGKAQAAPSKHDDWVASIGLGLYCMKFAGVYRPVSKNQRIFTNETPKKQVTFSY